MQKGQTRVCISPPGVSLVVYACPSGEEEGGEEPTPESPRHNYIYTSIRYVPHTLKEGNGLPSKHSILACQIIEEKEYYQQMLIGNLTAALIAPDGAEGMRQTLIHSKCRVSLLHPTVLLNSYLVFLYIDCVIIFLGYWGPSFEHLQLNPKWRCYRF